MSETPKQQPASFYTWLASVKALAEPTPSLADAIRAAWGYPKASPPVEPTNRKEWY